MSQDKCDNDAGKALLKREGLDTVEGAFACSGGELLSKPNLRGRQRVRLRLTDDAGRPVVWYLKRYGPVPWFVRLWRRLRGRALISGLFWEVGRN